MAKTIKGPMNYVPEKRTYTKPTSTHILANIKQARDMLGRGDAAGPGPRSDTLIEFGESVRESQAMSVEQLDFMVSLFKGQHNLGIPQDKRYVTFDAKSAKAADAVFRVLGMLLAPPLYRYLPPINTRGDKEQAEIIEKHLNAVDPWLFRTYRQRYDIQSLFWQILAGRSAIQQTYLPMYWDKQTLKQKSEEGDAAYNERVSAYKAFKGPPVFREAIDPRILFPVQTPMGPEAYVKIYRVQRFQAEAAFARSGKNVEFKLKGDGTVDEILELDRPRGLELPTQSELDTATSPMEYYEFIDDEYCFYCVGNDVVHSYQHHGGIKIFDSLGLQTGFKEIDMAGVGILWPVRKEIPQYDFMRTLWANKGYLDVFPQLIALLGEKDDPIQDEAGGPKAWNIEPGTIKQMRGNLVNALKDAQSGMDFRAILEMMASDIDLATIPNIARGVAGAQQPGYAINQLSQAMRTLWKPIIESRDQQYSDMGAHYLHIIKNVSKSETTVFAAGDKAEKQHASGEYYSIEPDDIEDFYYVDAKLNPELPIDKQGNMLTWWKLFQEGGASWDDYVRNGLGRADPIAYEKEVRRDQARKMFMPEALKDGMALGRVKLTNDIIEAAGLDDLNSVFAIDIQALKAARATQNPMEAGMAGAAANGAAPMPQSVPTGGNVPPAGGNGNGIAPTSGANPNNPAPGPRLGTGPPPA